MGFLGASFRILSDANMFVPPFLPLSYILLPRKACNNNKAKQLGITFVNQVTPCSARVAWRLSNLSARTQRGEATKTSGEAAVFLSCLSPRLLTDTLLVLTGLRQTAKLHRLGRVHTTDMTT